VCARRRQQDTGQNRSGEIHLQMKPRLHIHSDCRIFGGADNMVGSLMRNETVSQRYDVRFSYRYSPEYEKGFRARVATGVKTYPLTLLDIDVLFVLSARLPPLLDKAWKLLVLLSQIRYVFLIWNTLTLWRLFRTERPDLLHINNGGFPGAYSCNSAVFAARLAGIRRILYVVNNIAIPYNSPLRWTDYPFDRLVANIVTVFTTGSTSAAAELRKVLRLSVDRVRSLHTGIAPRALHESREVLLERLGVASNRTLFAMVAVIEKRKGHAVILQAMQMLRNLLDPEEMPILLIVGTGAKLPDLKAVIRSNALEDCVHCVGFQSNVFDYMNAIDVVVLPSISHEDFPNVILEAMSLGKAVVGSRVAGIPEQIRDMESGLLVEPGDAVELAQALFRLTTNPDLRRRLGQNALDRFNDQFREEIAVARYVKLYDELFDGGLRECALRDGQGDAVEASHPVGGA